MKENKLPGKILVIDDDKALCELLEEDLSRRGHSVWPVLSVIAAREILSQQDIDIVLTDLNMPGISGIDFCAELQRNRLDLPDQLGHEAGRSRPDVHVDVRGPLFVLQAGEGQQPVRVARIEQFFRRGDRVVDRFPNNLQTVNRHERTSMIL